MFQVVDRGIPDNREVVELDGPILILPMKSSTLMRPPLNTGLSN